MEKLMACDEYLASHRILSYAQVRDEVMTDELLFHVLCSGKALYLPRVQRDARELEIVRVSDLCDDLRIGTFGILEPVESLAAAGEHEIREIGLAVIPGIAFDREGYRLGYGGGYFDRFLPGLDKSCMTVGVCFEEQLVERLPRDSWDRPVKRVVAG